jgi:hypothetical protein
MLVIGLHIIISISKELEDSVLDAGEQENSPEGFKGLLAFKAIRLEYGWLTTPITSGRLKNLPRGGRSKAKSKLEAVEERLLN